MGYCLCTFPLKSRCCHQPAAPYPQIQLSGAGELKYSWHKLHGRQRSKKHSKTTQSRVFLGRHKGFSWEPLSPCYTWWDSSGCTGCDGVCGHPGAEDEGWDAGGKPGRAAGRRERPAAESPALSSARRMLGRTQLPGDGVTSRS